MIDKKITKFEDMPVWNDALEYAVSIYDLTKRFPKEELYSLTNQIRRSASSVSANISEGFGRPTKKDKSHFYSIAYGSLLETKNFIYLAKRLNYIDADEENRLINDSVKLQKQINAIISFLKS